MSRSISRREAVRRLSGIAASAIAVPSIVPASVIGQDAPSERIAVGVIGTGGKAWGGTQAMHKRGKCDVVALADPNRPNMSRYAKAFNVPSERCYSDFRELLGRADVDAVLVGTPDHWHVPISKAAAEKGKHVYCEKPLSNTVAEGRSLVSAVKKAGVVFQHGTQLRSLRAVRHACELVRNGYLGDVRKVVIGSPPGHATGDHPPQPVPDTLDWDLWLGPVEPIEYRPIIVVGIPGKGLRGWYFVSRFSLAGWIAGYGVHDIDIAQWGLGTEHTGPVSIEGRGEFPKSGLFDTVLGYELTFTYADGRQILMTDTSKNRHGVTFHGPEGWVYCRSNIQASDAKLLDLKLKESDTRLYESANHEQNFADCIRSGKQTITPAEVAHRSTSITLLGGICLKLGRKLEWDPKTERFVKDDAANALLDYEHRAPWRV